MKKLLSNSKMKTMGLSLLCFAALLPLTSCGDHEPRPAIYVPEQVLAATTTPPKPQGDYMQDEAAIYVLGLKKKVSQCNADKAAVRSVLTPIGGTSDKTQ